MKPATLDVPLGPERQRALALVTDRWALWILLAVHETDGGRFSQLAAAPGLSKRVLAERLKLLVDEGLLRTEQYEARPPRHRYLLTERGAQVRRLALATVHVAAGGVLFEDPLAPSRALARTRESFDDHLAPQATSTPHAQSTAHPADALLAGDLGAAREIFEATVAQLVRYDAQYRTSLLETLETWFACDTSVSVTAARLFAHRHTVRYRLDRVRELTGLDTTNTDHRERLALGIRAQRVLAAADALEPV